MQLTTEQAAEAFDRVKSQMDADKDKAAPALVLGDEGWWQDAYGMTEYMQAVLHDANSDARMDVYMTPNPTDERLLAAVVGEPAFILRDADDACAFLYKQVQAMMMEKAQVAELMAEAEAAEAAVEVVHDGYSSG